jgi:hypothetical protein
MISDPVIIAKTDKKFALIIALLATGLVGYLAYDASKASFKLLQQTLGVIICSFFLLCF